jgi:large subunit ribosomal protein L34e
MKVTKSKHSRMEKVKTTTGFSTHYKVSTPAQQKCASCKAILHGVPRKLHGKAKTKKRPSRPFGGVYCSKCSRNKIRSEAQK